MRSLKPRRAMFGALAALAILSLVAACDGQGGSENAGASPTAEPSADSHVPGGPGAGGQGAAGQSGADPGDPSVAGDSGGSSGDPGAAGDSGGRSEDQGTAGDSGGGPEDQSAAEANGGEPTAGVAGGDTDVPATFDTLTLVITEVPCFGAGCHNDDQNPLDLRVDDQLHARATSLISKNCGDIPIVNPGKPQQSALVKILKGPCGPTPRMPLGCVDDQDANCVPAEYLAAIEQWIAAGAPP